MLQEHFTAQKKLGDILDLASHVGASVWEKEESCSLRSNLGQNFPMAVVAAQRWKERCFSSRLTVHQVKDEGVGAASSAVIVHDTA